MAASMKMAVFCVVSPCRLHGTTTQKTAIFAWLTPCLEGANSQLVIPLIYSKKSRSLHFRSVVLTFTHLPVSKTLKFSIQDIVVLFVGRTGKPKSNDPSLFFPNDRVLPTIFRNVLSKFCFSTVILQAEYWAYKTQSQNKLNPTDCLTQNYLIMSRDLKLANSPVLQIHQSVYSIVMPRTSVWILLEDGERWWLTLTRTVGWPRDVMWMLVASKLLTCVESFCLIRLFQISLPTYSTLS
jgi:hypothetical protein